jgi:RNA polymerase sigma factor (sigma-70 family)
MAHATLDPLISRLRRTAEAAATGHLTDRELLERYVTRRDEAAFAALVRRHGGLVIAACRRVLSDAADVDDAFQATFLVLLHKASSIRWQPSLGSWLYTVAHRMAVRTRAHAQRRRRLEDRAAVVVTNEAAAPDLSWREACAVLHEELDRLPERYRLPLVLCYLEGQSRDEAARALGWTVGAVKGRLERGRERLRQRLVRRGVTLSAGLLAAVAAPSRAAVPIGLVDSVVSMASPLATPAAAAGHAALLAQGVLHAMKLRQIQRTMAFCLLFGSLVAGVVLPALRAKAEKPAPVVPADPPPPPAANASPQTAAPAKVTVQGRVLDPSGQPVAGAKLFLPARPKPGPEQAEGAEAVLQTATGTDGRFRFETEPTEPPMNYFRQLVAVAAGYGPDWADPMKPGPDGEVVLRLVPDDVPIRGRVVDLEGRPVAGAVVRPTALETTPEENLTPVFRSWPTEPYYALQLAKKKLYVPRAAGLPGSVPTDRDGRFELRGVGRGRIVALRVEAEAIEHRTIRAVTQAGFDPKSVAPPPGARTPPGYRGVRPWPDLYGPDFVHSARPSQSVVGTVRDRATGKPLAGVGVNGSAKDAWWENHAYTKTDEQGRYRLIGLPKVPERRLGFHAGDNSPYLEAGYLVKDIEGVGPITFDVGLVRGVVINGRVTERATGKPVRGAGIHYNPLAGNPSFDKTPGSDIHRFASIGYSADADGRFRLVALPGPGLISAQAETRGDHRNSPYTQVRLDPADRPRADVSRLDAMGVTFLTADGHIESLEFQSAYKVIDPPAGSDTLNLELQFDTGRSVSGTVVDPEGKPLAGCTVYGLRATWDRLETLKEAAFTAIALDPELPRTAAFLHKGRKLAGVIKLTGAETTAPTAKLQPCGAVTGRVRDEEGRPVNGAKVMLYYRDRKVSAIASIRPTGGIALDTDRDGRFRIELVVPGQEFGISFQQKGRFLDTGNKYNKLTITPGEAKDLGDIPTRPFGD